mmetsp:Transcript_11653/g.12818  ORF Transcript_11653/g.12818 Transcript_11653/m.12818 type:complete len:261 (+) Transcript_11653:36-818(+)|eukprot:CAMPEP_0115019740 /NCGR_PEP_ID=MMETSP0216-20121206/29638_1 /TAXON_ID=223996 /ORGANISM="Protocruzia adherens, Strain Boccale" /LENGTH=260 /DNA_ID=CAMNT_0002391297 /DNA_START=33 /DNA_END=815 /DNA_ORIENTATION=-
MKVLKKTFLSCLVVVVVLQLSTADTSPLELRFSRNEIDSILAVGSNLVFKKVASDLDLATLVSSPYAITNTTLEHMTIGEPKLIVDFKEHQPAVIGLEQSGISFKYSFEWSGLMDLKGRGVFQVDAATASLVASLERDDSTSELIVDVDKVSFEYSQKPFAEFITVDEAGDEGYLASVAKNVAKKTTIDGSLKGFLVQGYKTYLEDVLKSRLTQICKLVASHLPEKALFPGPIMDLKFALLEDPAVEDEAIVLKYDIVEQ